MNSSSNSTILAVASTSAVDFPDNESNAFLKHAGRITDIYSNNPMPKGFSQILKNATSTVSQETKDAVKNMIANRVDLQTSEIEVRSRDGQTSTTLINQKNKGAHSDQQQGPKLTIEEHKKLLADLMDGYPKIKIVRDSLRIGKSTFDKIFYEIKEKHLRFKELLDKLISNNSFHYPQDYKIKQCDKIVTEWWNSNEPEDTSRKQDQDDKNTNKSIIKQKVLKMFEQELVSKYQENAKGVPVGHKRRQKSKYISNEQEIQHIVQNKNMIKTEKIVELCKQGVTYYRIATKLGCHQASIKNELNNYFENHPDDRWLGEIDLCFRQIIQRYSEKRYSPNEIADIYHIRVDYVKKSLQYPLNLKKLTRVNLSLEKMKGICESFFIKCDGIDKLCRNENIHFHTFYNFMDTLALNSKLLAPLTQKIRQTQRMGVPRIEKSKKLESVKQEWYTSYFSKDKPITTDIPMDTIDEKIKELIPIACRKIYQTKKEHDVKSSGSNPRKRLSDLSMSNRDDSGSPKKSRVIDDAEGAPTLFDQSKPIQIEYASGVIAESSLEKHLGLRMRNRDDSTPQNRSAISYAKSTSTPLNQGNPTQAGYASGVVAESSLEKHLGLGMSNSDDSTPQNMSVISYAKSTSTPLNQGNPTQAGYASGVVEESYLAEPLDLRMRNRDDSIPQNRSVINYAKSASTLLSQGNPIQAGYDSGVVEESYLAGPLDLSMRNRDDSIPQNRTGIDHSEKMSR